MTAGDLIAQALQNISVLPAGERPAPAAMRVAFQAMNRMLEAWECPIAPLPDAAISDPLIALPPDYKLAIIYNLAVALAPVYGVRPSRIAEQMALDTRRCATGDWNHLTEADYEALVLLREARSALVAQLESRRAA